VSDVERPEGGLGEFAGRGELDAAALMAREELLSTVAHDLRSPLGAISVSAEMLLEFELGDQGRRYHLEVIQRASARMSRMIQDFLDVTRLESGRLELEVYRQDVVPILEEVCALLAARARARSVGLTWSAEPPVEALVDRFRLLQILENLTNDAVRRCREGGRVLVGAKAIGDDEVRISVANDGGRMTAAEAARVFDRGGWSGGPGGEARLGLAIARGLVERHGGRIWLDAECSDGNRFCVSLPPGERVGGKPERSRRAAIQPVGSG
jgi:signal transduction histidine kinase